MNKKKVNCSNLNVFWSFKQILKCYDRGYLEMQLMKLQYIVRHQPYHTIHLSSHSTASRAVQAILYSPPQDTMTVCRFPDATLRKHNSYGLAVTCFDVSSCPSVPVGD